MSAPLFQPFRALGYITDSVPYSVQRLGRESFVTVSVGKSWQVRCSSLYTSEALYSVPVWSQLVLKFVKKGVLSAS